MSATALVTGGAGFVGRHFVKALLGRGDTVTVVDDLSSGIEVDRWPEVLAPDSYERKRLRFVHADIRDYAASRPGPRFDLVLHLAAVVGGRLTIEGDPLRVGTDLAIDATVFNWCTSRGSEIGTFVYFSSSAAYPIALQTRSAEVPLTESMIDFGRDAIGCPDMTYGWAKLTGEYLARVATEHNGLRVVTYRPFSGYGADQDLTYPFPSIIRRGLSRADPILIWGSGEQARDFVHIDDAVGLVLQTCEVLPSGSVLNIGTGVRTTFIELAELVCAAVGYSPRIVTDLTKPEGVFARVADVQGMIKFYTPKVDLQSGIESCLAQLDSPLAV